MDSYQKKDVVTHPWYKIAADLIKPWDVKVKNRLMTFNALIIINTATSLIKIALIYNKLAHM